MANHLGLELHQVDIKGTYLNGELNEDEILYMQFQPGYKPCDAGNHVLRLKKTLYGLKQSGQCWYQKLFSIFESLGFQKCLVDQAVFHKSDKNKNEVTVIAVHVDNCTIAASNLRLIEEFKAGLKKHVESPISVNFTGCWALKSSKIGTKAPSTYHSVHTSTQSCDATTLMNSSPFPLPWTLPFASPQTSPPRPQQSTQSCTISHTVKP